MEKEENKLEQPCFVLPNSQCEKSMSEESGAEFVVQEENKGSNINFGKFKSGEELIKAYNNLQSDYTRKCQALAVSQKQLEDKEKETKEKGFVSPKEVLKQANQMQKEFYSSHPEAKEFFAEIEKIVNEEDFGNLNTNPYLTAWQTYKAKNFVSPKALIEDENFLQNYVYNNPVLTQEILKRYFSGLKQESTPILIGNQPGSKTILSPVNKPKTIEEAGKIASDMFS